MADPAGAFKQGEAVGADDLVDVLLPKAHAGFLTVLGPQFGGFEEDDDEAVEGIDFVLGQVVLGDEDVGLADLVAFPREQAKVRVGRVGAGGDEFGRGVAGDGVKQDVLDRGKKLLGGAVGLVVVGAEGEEVADLLVKAFLRGADVADAREHLVEMVRAAIGVFEPLVVHREAFEEVFLEDGGGPATELDAPRRAHAVADGEDGLKVVERDRPTDFAAALDLNYRGFLGSCRTDEFAVLVDVLEVQADIVGADIKKLGHFALTEPHGLVLGPELDAALAVFGGVEDQHGRRIESGPGRDGAIFVASRKWSAEASRRRKRAGSVLMRRGSRGTERTAGGGLACGSGGRRAGRFGRRSGRRARSGRWRCGFARRVSAAPT